MAGPLAGIRVLDLTHLLAGPFATKLFADYGADVIKIEPPGGEPGRWLRPFQGDEPNPEKSGTFFALNTNKRSVVLDLKSPAGKQGFSDLANGADFVIENFRPGTMDRLGLGYEQLRASKDQALLISLTNFGQTGPWRDFKGSETILYGMGGHMYHQGLDGRSPLKQGGTATLLQAGGMTAAAAMAALLTLKRYGRGQWVDLSIYEMQSASNDRRQQAYMVWQFSKYIHRRRADVAETLATGVFPCADGYVEIFGDFLKWDRITKMLGDPPELLDERWKQPGVRNSAEMIEIFNSVWYPWLLSRTKLEVWDACQEATLLSGPLYTMEDLYKDPVFRERGYWVEVEHAVMGKVTIPGRPFIMYETPWELRRSAPLLGEHTAEVLREIGYSDAQIAAVEGEAAADRPHAGSPA